MNILAIGDLVGENGLEKLEKILPKVKEEYKIDFIIVNSENVAGGMGISLKTFHRLLKLEVDVMTMGNHTWAKKDIFEFIDHPKLLRPANYSKGVQGKGYAIYDCKSKKIAVVDLIGRTNMGVLSENPFTVVEEIIQEISEKVDMIFVDFHAEATAEKIAMKYCLDGKVTALFGTHTHVQTADEEITMQGMGVEASVKRFQTSLPERYKLAEGECIFNGVVFEINDENSRTKKITRLFIR